MSKLYLRKSSVLQMASADLNQYEVNVISKAEKKKKEEQKEDGKAEEYIDEEDLRLETDRKEDVSENKKRTSKCNENDVSKRTEENNMNEKIETNDEIN